MILVWASARRDIAAQMMISYRFQGWPWTDSRGEVRRRGACPYISAVRPCRTQDAGMRATYEVPRCPTFHSLVDGPARLGD